MVLLDVRKAALTKFLDRIETLLQAAGAASTARAGEGIFSRPVARTLLDGIHGQADLVVEALAD